MNMNMNSAGIKDVINYRYEICYALLGQYISIIDMCIYTYKIHIYIYQHTLKV